MAFGLVWNSGRAYQCGNSTPCKGGACRGCSSHSLQRCWVPAPQVKAACEREKGADCQMGGFTRILHSGKPDDLMSEIPTVVVEPLPDKENKGCGIRVRALVWRGFFFVDF